MLNHLKFPVSEAIYSAYATSYPDLFDSVIAALSIPIYPEEYTPISEPLGETQPIRGIKTTVYPSPIVVRGFEVLIRDNTPIIGIVLNLLRNDSSHNIITVHDYVLPDDGDIYTVRKVRLPMPILGSTGTFNGSGHNYIVGGYTIRFEPI